MILAGGIKWKQQNFPLCMCIYPWAVNVAWTNKSLQLYTADDNLRNQSNSKTRGSTENMRNCNQILRKNLDWNICVAFLGFIPSLQTFCYVRQQLKVLQYLHGLNEFNRTECSIWVHTLLFISSVSFLCFHIPLIYSTRDSKFAPTKYGR